MVGSKRGDPNGGWPESRGVTLAIDLATGMAISKKIPEVSDRVVDSRLALASQQASYTSSKASSERRTKFIFPRKSWASSIIELRVSTLSCNRRRNSILESFGPTNLRIAY